MTLRPPPLAATRRGFLHLLGSGAALAALGRAAALPGAARAATGSDSGFFDPRRREILTQIVERVVDTGEPGGPRVRDTGAVASIEALLGRLDPSLSEPLPALLDVFDWSPIVFDFVPTRFTRATDAQKDAALRSWMTSRIALRRVAFQALRNLSFVGWYAQDASWPLVGYAGPLLARGARP
jgi:hypothetical protein